MTKIKKMRNFPILFLYDFTDPFLERKRYNLCNDEPCLAYTIHTYGNILTDHLDGLLRSQASHLLYPVYPHTDSSSISS
jgi:hypothetical protein